nr:nuclear transport factor 2 family protein [uncultured Chryseobacterium sp.]
MKKEALSVVQQMFNTFQNGDIKGFKEVVSEDTVWVYYGTKDVPAGVYEGKERAAEFINNILIYNEIVEFTIERFITQEDVVVVLGNEHFKVKNSDKEIKQRWVQVYTVKDGLITHMEEFATPSI